MFLDFIVLDIFQDYYHNVVKNHPETQNTVSLRGLSPEQLIVIPYFQGNSNTKFGRTFCCHLQLNVAMDTFELFLQTSSQSNLEPLKSPELSTSLFMTIILAISGQPIHYFVWLKQVYIVYTIYKHNSN